MIPTQVQKHIVFMSDSFTGHMNPTLPIVSRLREKECKVSFFVEDTMRDVVEAAGATWYPFKSSSSSFTGVPKELDSAGVQEFVPQGTPAEEYTGLHNPGVYNSRNILPALLEDLKSLEPSPSLILYDPFLAFPLVAAHVLKIPAVGILTMPGPGSSTGLSELGVAVENKPWVELPRREIQRKYGYDVLENGTALNHYSPTCTLVSTIDELFAPPRSVQVERFGTGFPFKCVGALVDVNVKRIQHATKDNNSAEQNSLPFDFIDKGIQRGKKLLYVSLGTVATGPNLWNSPMDLYVKGNDEVDLVVSGSDRPLGSYTGKEFCQYVWKTCMEAVGNDDDVLVVMCVGPQADAQDGLPPLPSNFIVRQTVPQLEVLRRSSAFVTHGGANSVHESLSMGVPLAVVPIFGDQPQNADAVQCAGAGLSYRHPLRTLSAAELRKTLREMMGLSESNIYQTGALRVAKKLGEAGGVNAAVTAILEHSI